VSGVLEAWYAGSDGRECGGEYSVWRCKSKREAADDFPQSVLDLPASELVSPGPGQSGEAAVVKTGEAKADI